MNHRLMRKRLRSEKEIYKKELDKVDKKEDIKRNILDGKMKKFINDNTLLNQPFVKDPSQPLLKLFQIMKYCHIIDMKLVKV